MNLPKSRFVLVLLTAMLVAGLLNITVAPAAIATPDKQAIKVEVDNKLLAFDVSPFIEKGRVLVPARTLFEALGASVEWDGKSKTVTAEKNDTVIKLTVGSKIASITQRGVTQVVLDAPAKIVNGRTMVPLRLISEAFGAKVAWDDQSRLVRIATGVPAKEELVIALNTYSPSKAFKVAGCTQIYEPLLFLNRKLEVQPGLVLSWDRLDDLTWSLKIREGVKFHNGKEFDAESAKFAFTIYLDQLKTGYVGQRVSQVVDHNSFKVVDKYTLEIKTLRPYPFLPNLMTHGSIAGFDPEAISKGEVVGTGPFKFKEEVKDQYVIVERNDEYWGEKPYFKRIVFKPIPDANTRVMALQRGEVDVVLYPPYPLINELRKDFNVVVAPRGCTAILLFNHNRPQMQDINLRKALCMAFEKDKIVSRVFYGTASPAKAIVPPEVIYSAENEIQGWSYNPNEAKRLIGKAGYRETDRGYVDKNGQPLKLRFTYYAPEEGYKELAEAIGSYYKKIGIETDIVGLDSNAYYKEVIEEGNFDICLDLVGLFWGSPSTMLYDQLYSKSGLIGYHRPEDEEIDRLLEEGMELESRKDLAGAAEKYKAAQKRALEELVVSCPIAYQKHIVVSKKNVKGLSPFPMYRMYFNGDAEKELIKVRWEE
ncbi:MAG: hypothetical protein HPY58_00380 [Firmicutes bacterium]|nr:hypothetical protein [Bacillota bacterium]